MVGLAWALVLAAALPRGDRVEDAEREVRLALKAEADGKDAERREHLRRAVALAPEDPRARGLLGQMAVGKGWERADVVAAKLRGDEARAATLAEYNARRARTPETAEGQWRLALWCERHGLKAEAEAHLVAVTRLDPTRAAAWVKLGCVRDGDRWVRPERLAAERAEAAAQARADRSWGTRLAELRRGLADPARHDEAARALGEVRDPRAVPTIWRLFAAGSGPSQAWAAWMLGHIDTPASSQALAALAVVGKGDPARDRAAAALRRRDPHQYLGSLIQMLQDRYAYRARRALGPEAPGVLVVEGQRSILERFYEVPEPVGDREPGVTTRTLLDPQAGRNSRFMLVVDAITLPGDFASALRREVREMDRALAHDVAHLDEANRRIERTNGRVFRLLRETTGLDLGADREAWTAWWTEELGYSYQRPDPAPKPVIVQETVARQAVVPSSTTYRHRVASFDQSCFAAGTPVRTVEGLRAIEGLKVGDVVLSQDVETGALAFEPIVRVIHNPPHETLRVVVDDDGRDEAIVATPIHRFWRAGGGWAMARELKAGDRIRTDRGLAAVRRVEESGVRPVFNLEVARAATYFVGWAGALVHDNSVVAPVARPFDRAGP